MSTGGAGTGDGGGDAAQLVPAPTPHHTLRALQAVAELGPLAARLHDSAVWHAAMKLPGPVTPEQLGTLAFSQRELWLWAIETRTTQRWVATGIVSYYLLDWHLAVVHEGPFDPACHAEALGSLCDAVFGAMEGLRAVWTALPLPEPPGGEETLCAMGFTHVPSGADGDLRRTYGLFRHIWQAYKS